MEKFIVRPSKDLSTIYAAYAIIGSCFKSCKFLGYSAEGKCAVNFRLLSDKKQEEIEERFIAYIQKNNLEEKLQNEEGKCLLQIKNNNYILYFKSQSFKLSVEVFSNGYFRIR